MDTKSMKKVCIIGAGASGIAAAKVFKEEGIPYDCYEKGSKIGGLWRYNNDNGHSAAYKSLHINTNKKVMAYSDFPMPEDYPMFPHHSQIVTYFERYAEHFGFLGNITFNTAVSKVNPLKDGSGFEVILEDRSSHFYEYVIVGNGHHWKPKWPKPAFEGVFTGESMHSHSYREVSQLQNKNILIVGIGNSAVDIACEAARLHTGKVTISTRSGAHIVPNWIWSMPLDDLANPLTARLPLWFQRKLLSVTLWLARGRQEDYGVPKPNRPLLSEHPTLSQDLLNIAGRGLVDFKPNISRFEGKSVFFTDGSREEYDLVIFATGYQVSFPFLAHLEEFNVEENQIELFKHVIHPKFDRLLFLGLIQPLGAIMPLAEVQSKWMAKIVNGQYKIPAKDKMLSWIERNRKQMQKRYKKSSRHTLQVDFYKYKGEIIDEIT
jgi:dimethylaniline monooxygenase (N-oxide forming)